MRKAGSSKSLLAWLPNQVAGVLDVGGCCRSSLGRILISRSFASDVSSGSTDAPPAAVDDPQSPKDELGRWWQTFSEQRRAQAGNQQKTGKGRESNRRSTSKGNQLSHQGPQESLTREAGTNRWFIPKAEQQVGQEKPEALNKESISRWFLPKDKESSSTELERQEITSQQVGARWLASAREKSSTEPEPADPSSSRWFGFNKQPTQASERERLEVSMQRLALMSKLGDKSQTPSFMFLPPKDNLLRKYFHWDNLSSPEKHKVALTKVRESFALHKTDCGSSEVQIALLTAKIKYMTQHMASHRKDYHSRKGLEGMVQQRRKVLKYLRRKNWDSYCEVITKLGLRDNVMEPQKR